MVIRFKTKNTILSLNIIILHKIIKVSSEKKDYDPDTCKLVFLSDILTPFYKKTFVQRTLVCFIRELFTINCEQSTFIILIKLVVQIESIVKYAQGKIWEVSKFSSKGILGLFTHRQSRTETYVKQSQNTMIYLGMIKYGDY